MVPDALLSFGAFEIIAIPLPLVTFTIREAVIKIISRVRDFL